MKRVLLIVLFLASPLVGLTQGTFRNLDFEEATLPPPHEGLETVEDAVPGWTVLYGTNVQSGIFRDGYGAGGESGLRIWERDILPYPLDGDYFVEFVVNDLDPHSVSLVQNGVAPEGTLSLRFLTALYWWRFPEVMEVRVNGTLLPLQVLSATPASAVYGADVSAFAGQPLELRFTHLQETSVPGMFLDNIEFSPVPIPEPSGGSLVLLGLAIWCWRKRFGRVR